MRLLELALKSLGAGDLREQLEKGWLPFRDLQKDFTEARLGFIWLGVIPERIKIRKGLR